MQLDFESAPFSHLGTSPQPPYYISIRLKNQGFFLAISKMPAIFSQMAL